MNNTSVSLPGKNKLEFTTAQPDNVLRGRAGYALKSFIAESFDGAVDAEQFYWLDTADPDQIPEMNGSLAGLVNLQRINDIPGINAFLEEANRKLYKSDYLLVCAETKHCRKIRILNKYPKFLSRPYYLMDFMLKRVFPKWKPTRKIYFSITGGRNRVLSFTEVLGRLSSCGFTIQNSVRVGYQTYFLAKKTDEPHYVKEMGYGALIRLKRVGYRGELIDVFKMRTMHPYSEYLQEHIYNMNGTGNGDKITNDFRVTTWGKWFRKLWIDELPMLLNYTKGEMKLVGPRPLSQHKFYTYPEWLQEQRIKYKPGLVPPFYADLPKTSEEFYQSEAAYLNAYEKHPIRTDIRYFFKAFHNILIKGARSA